MTGMAILAKAEPQHTGRRCGSPRIFCGCVRDTTAIPRVTRPNGAEDVDGRIVHPQNWPEDLDYTGKSVVTGSGATAATLILAIAAEGGHVTMLQRSPTFFRTGRNAVPIADELRALDIDEAWIHEIVRRKILHEQSIFTRRVVRRAGGRQAGMLAGVPAHLGPTEEQPNPRNRTDREEKREHFH